MCLAIPGKVMHVETDTFAREGEVSFEGIRKKVCLAFTPDATPGDYVLVHAGVAIGKVDEEEAQRILELLRALSEEDSA